MRVLKNERLEKEVLLTISKNDLLRDLHAELLSQSHKVKKPGFRSGKLPLSILFQERGAQALDSVIHQWVLNSFSQVVEDKTIAVPLSYRVETPLDGLSLETLSDVDVKIHAIFSPEIPEIKWEDVGITHYITHPTDEEVDAQVAERASKSMTSVALAEKRPAEVGDTLVYTMTYTHQDGSVKTVNGSFQLGTNTLPEEFEKTLTGISEGHVMSESLKVPKDFPDKSLAGKKVNFSITFHEIRATVPHQVNEEFVKSQGFETLDALRDAARHSLVESGEILSDVLLRKDLKKKLETIADFDVPETWVEDALKALKADGTEDTSTGEASPSHGTQQEQALGSVRSHCIVQHVIKDQKFTVKDAELLGYVRAMAQSEGKSLDDAVGFLRRNKAMVDRISEDILERKALIWISQQCAKEDKEISFENLKTLFHGESL